MPPAPPIARHENDTDHAVRLQCFRAALAGRSEAGLMVTDIISTAASIADAALKQEQLRRPKDSR
jgi:hypothetical protein